MSRAGSRFLSRSTAGDSGASAPGAPPPPPSPATSDNRSPVSELGSILADSVRWTAGAALARAAGGPGASSPSLDALRAAADASPGDAAATDALHRALAARGVTGRAELCMRVEAASGPLPADVASAYLAAAAATGRLSGGGAGPPLPSLLADLAARSAGGALPDPGASPGRPLHIALAAGAAGGLTLGRAAAAPSPLAAVVSGVATSVALVALFALGLSAARGGLAPRLGGSGAPGGGAPGMPQAPPGFGGGAAAPAAGQGFAPNQYQGEDTPEASKVRFADVQGCDEAKAELEEVVDFLKDPARFTALGGKLPKGVLLTGPPGTGKTMLARAIAGEAGVPFFFRAGSEFEEMFVGVGARRARALFAAAKKAAPCIVFIDEIDAVGGPRNAAWDGGGGRKTLHQLLVEMDGFEQNSGVIVVAATNVGDDGLDPALVRAGRFDRRVAVPLPDVRGRMAVVGHYLAKAKLDPAVDATELAGSIARRTPGFSGAQLAAMVNEAALLAARRRAPAVTPALLDEARDRLLMGAERRSLVQSAASRRLTAYHEGGHALVALTTAGARPVHKATIVPRGHALGMVSQLPDGDETSVTRAQLRAQIDVAMGGKAAEALAFGDDAVTSGARSDLRAATAVARHMVAECGMSDAVGPRFVGGEGKAGGVSADVARSVDAEVGTLLRDAYARVYALLKSKEPVLHALAAALLEHETLTADDIRAVAAGTFSRAPPAPRVDEASEREVLAALGVDVGGGRGGVAALKKGRR